MKQPCVYFYVTFAIVLLQGVLAEDSVIIGKSEFPTTPTPNEFPEATVSCTTKEICISVDLYWLKKEWNITDEKGLVIGDKCKFKVSRNLTHISTCSTPTDLIRCDSLFNVNDSHVSYSNNLTLVGTPPSSRRTVKATLQWTCTYPTNLLVGNSFMPEISPIQVFLGKQSGEGRFQAAMILYSDENYQIAFDKAPNFDMGGRIRAKVQLLKSPSDAKLQVISCWGSPGKAEEKKFYIIENNCPAPEAMQADVAIMNNGMSHHAMIETNVFRFVDNEEVYLHCHVRVCFNKTACYKNCERTRKDNRQRRSVEINFENDAVLSVGPIVMSQSIPIIPEINKLYLDFNDIVTQPYAPLDVRVKPENTDKIFGLDRVIAFIIIGLLALGTTSVVLFAFVLIRRKIHSNRTLKVEKLQTRQRRVNRKVSRRVTINSGFGIPIDLPI